MRWGLCCCQRGCLAEGISLPGGIVSRCRGVRRSRLHTSFKPSRCLLMPRQRLLVGDAFSNGRTFMLGAVETLQPFWRISLPLEWWVLPAFTGRVDGVDFLAGAVLSHVLAQRCHFHKTPVAGIVTLKATPAEGHM